MKQYRKIFFVLVCLLLPWMATAQTDDGEFQLEWDENSFRMVGGDDKHSVTKLINDFLKERNGKPKKGPNGEPLACLRIKIENMSEAEARDLDLEFATGGDYSRPFEFDRSEMTWMCRVIAVGPKSDGKFRVRVKMRNSSVKSDWFYGKGAQLKAGEFYDVTLRSKQRYTISFEGTKPDDVDVYVDGERAEGRKAKVYGGGHVLTYSRKGTALKRRDTIDVSSENYHFPMDLRTRHSVRITSDPKGATVTVNVDGRDVRFGTTPTTVELPEGKYSMTTTLGTMKDSRVLVVQSGKNSEHVVLEQRKNVEFYVVYQGMRTEASLHISRIGGGEITDRSQVEGYKQIFNVTLPYGSYNVWASDGTRESKPQRITVSDRSEARIPLELRPPKSTIVWPWKRAFDERPVGLAFQYVQRRLVYSLDEDESSSMHSDIGFRELDDVTNGVRVGIHFQPCLDWGMGLYFGAFFEYLYSKTPYSEKANTNDATLLLGKMYTTFSEKVISVPLHLCYRVPFSDDFAVSVHGGLDADYLFGAIYKDKDGVFMQYEPDYDGDQHYKHFNFSYAVGAAMQWGWLMVEADWSWGMRKVFEVDGYHTTMNRFNVGMSILF